MSYSVRSGPLDTTEFRQLWDDLAAGREIDPLATYTYASATADAQRLSATAHVVVENDAPVVGLVTYDRRRGFLHETLLPRFTPHNPFLSAQRYTTKAIPHAVLSFLAQHLEDSYDWIRIHLPTYVDDVRSFQWRSWEASPLYTYYMDLSVDGDRLLEGWSGSTRRTVRKNDSAFELRQNGNAGIEVTSLCRESYTRQGTDFPMTDEEVATIIDAATKNAFCDSFTLHDNTGRAVAGVAALRNGDLAYYWLAGSQPGPAMTVLLGKVLPVLQASGIRTFDFVGANTPSIAEFKRRFGPELKSYFRLSKIPRRSIRLLAQIRKAARR